jgi:hypothetical protein
MCVQVRALSLIRRVEQKKFNSPDVRLHGLDAQALYMEIACISSTIRMSYFMVQTLKALIWKLHAAKLQPFGRLGNTVRTRLNSRKNFSEFGKPIAQLSILTPSASIRTPPTKFKSYANLDSCSLRSRK